MRMDYRYDQLKIWHSQSNSPLLCLQGIPIGTLDKINKEIKLNYTKEDFEKEFGKGINLSEWISYYYDEIEIIDEDCNFNYTTQYNIKYK